MTWVDSKTAFFSRHMLLWWISKSLYYFVSSGLVYCIQYFISISCLVNPLLQSSIKSQPGFLLKSVVLFLQIPKFVDWHEQIKNKLESKIQLWKWPAILSAFRGEQGPVLLNSVVLIVLYRVKMHGIEFQSCGAWALPAVELLIERENNLFCLDKMTEGIHR